ncbi:MAG: hypothetical protein GY930_19695 [bacterium]|nr:hypothetical protein [bacterium]
MCRKKHYHHHESDENMSQVNLKAPHLVAIAILIAGLAIAYAVSSGEGRYQMVSHGSTLLVFDTASGKTWKKFCMSNYGSTEWEEEKSPWSE